MNHAMTCSEYEALLGSDLEGDLSREDRQRAEAHLLDCARCAALRAELVGIAEAARALPLMAPSRDLWDGISSRIEAKSAGSALPSMRAAQPFAVVTFAHAVR